MDVTFSVGERRDGGRWAELSVGGERGLERVLTAVPFEDRDPALLWYVDVRWDVADPPRTQAAAADWYSAHRPAVEVALAQMADVLAVGLDIDEAPVIYPLDTPAGPARAYVSALKRLGPGRVAASLREAMALDLLAVEPLEVGATA